MPHVYEPGKSTVTARQEFLQVHIEFLCMSIYSPVHRQGHCVSPAREVPQEHMALPPCMRSPVHWQGHCDCTAGEFPRCTWHCLHVCVAQCTGKGTGSARQGRSPRNTWRCLHVCVAQCTGKGTVTARQGNSPRYTWRCLHVCIAQCTGKGTVTARQGNSPGAHGVAPCKHGPVHRQGHCDSPAKEVSPYKLATVSVEPRKSTMYKLFR